MPFATYRWRARCATTGDIDGTVKRPFIAALFLLSSIEALAETYYVGPTATGDGSGGDWANVLPWSTSLARGTGNTYYLKNGSYGSGKTFSTAASGTTVITVRRATATDHGTETGWQPAFGTGGVIVAGTIAFTTPYWIVDGNDNTYHSYGIRLNVPFDGALGSPNERGISITTSDVIVRSVYVYGGTTPHDNRAAYVYSASSSTLQHIQLHNFGKDFNLLGNSSNITYDDLWIHGGMAAVGEHCDAWEINGDVSDNITIKNSLIDYSGQNIFFGGTPPLTHPGPYHIYGNVFTGGGPAIKERDPGLSTINNLYVYNNTFEATDHAFELGLGSGDIRNNLLYLNAYDGGLGDKTHDYNASDKSISETHFQLLTSDPFVSRATQNYHLSGPTTAGDATVGSPYGTDADGVTRSVDGVWDRGAYEYGAGVPATPAPSPPSVLSVQ